MCLAEISLEENPQCYPSPEFCWPVLKESNTLLAFASEHF